MHPRDMFESDWENSLEHLLLLLFLSFRSCFCIWWFLPLLSGASGLTLIPLPVLKMWVFFMFVLELERCTAASVLSNRTPVREREELASDLRRPFCWSMAAICHSMSLDSCCLCLKLLVSNSVVKSNDMGLHLSRGGHDNVRCIRSNLGALVSGNPCTGLRHLDLGFWFRWCVSEVIETSLTCFKIFWTRSKWLRAEMIRVLDLTSFMAWRAVTLCTYQIMSNSWYIVRGLVQKLTEYEDWLVSPDNLFAFAIYGSLGIYWRLLFWGLIWAVESREKRHDYGTISSSTLFAVVQKLYTVMARVDQSLPECTICPLNKKDIYDKQFSSRESKPKLPPLVRCFYLETYSLTAMVLYHTFDKRRSCSHEP